MASARPQDMADAKAQTQAVYDRHAQAWHAGRRLTVTEKSWLTRFEKEVGSTGSLLDLGCGSGVPFASYFLEKGYELTGVDFAPAMIGIARETWPQASWLVQDIARLKVEGPFTGIYSWDGFFHLDQAAQRALLPKLVGLLAPGGVLMLTVGDHDGEVTGTVEGETVYHASLAAEDYETILASAGCKASVIHTDKSTPCCRTVLLANKGSIITD